MVFRCCYFLGAICIIGVFLFTILFHTVSESYCEGEWGAGNVGDKKTGVGRCIWRVGITSVIYNSSVLLRETSYEGSWLNGHKHGFGKYKSFSNVAYEGMWSTNKRDGDGVLVINDKTKYVGKWHNDSFTCDDGILEMICDGRCTYASTILTGSMKYQGRVARGLPHGTGPITFSDSPRRIELSFHKGEVRDKSPGSLTLSNKKNVRIDSFSEEWGITSHNVQAQLSSEARTYTWNGHSLSVDGGSEVVGAHNSTNTEAGEVYELLNALRIFQMHFQKNQLMLESEIYDFETAEQNENKKLRKEAKEKEDREKKEQQEMEKIFEKAAAQAKEEL